MAIATGLAVLAGAAVVVGGINAYVSSQASKDAAESIERSAEDQLDFEKDRAAEEQLRYDANVLEEKKRFGDWNTEDQARYDAIKLEEQTRYDAKTTEEKARYDQQWKFYEDLNTEDKARYQEAKIEEQGRYESEKVRIAAMTGEEQQRYKASADRISGLDLEEQTRFYALKGEEQSRYMSMTGEEQSRYETQLGERGERFGKAEALVKPFLSSAEAAQKQLNIELGLEPGEAGTAYMQTPGYKQAMEERQAGVEQTAATMGETYSGRRMKEAAKAGSDVQSQYYSNYMNMLTAAASPETAKALAGMGIGQQQVTGNLPGMGQLQTGAPGAGQTLGVGSPYISGPDGTPMYERPGAGSAPGSVYMTGTPPSPGSGAYTPPPGTGNIPPVGGGMVDAATAEANARYQGDMAFPSYAQDVVGLGTNIYSGYLEGGGGYIPPPTPTQEWV